MILKKDKDEYDVPQMNQIARACVFFDGIPYALEQIRSESMNFRKRAQPDLRGVPAYFSHDNTARKMIFFPTPDRKFKAEFLYYDKLRKY